MAEIAEVKKFITDENRYEVKKVTKWVVNLTNTANEIIAARKQAFSKKADAELAVKEIIEFGKKL